ncbi:hypothetical protein ACFXDE_28740 [Kitasatospora sp. NPDC059408]|uniref:hypothetical protein n=1 Tax=Kitasatospora sp. NPDC059408 TaxID=3346823 RepID=UPI0036B1F79A
MTRRIGPLQQMILDALRKAQGPEPYPVLLRWNALAIALRRPRSELGNIRRAVANLHLVEEVEWPDSYSYNSYGVRLVANQEQHWLWEQLITAFPYVGRSATASDYRRPTAAEVRVAFEQGCYSSDMFGVELAALTSLVNAYCQTSYDPAEVAWERERRARQKDQLMCGTYRLQLSRAMHNLAAKLERQSIEARMVTVGPFRVDPQMALDSCPCCLRTFTADSQPEPAAILATAFRQPADALCASSSGR